MVSDGHGRGTESSAGIASVTETDWRSFNS